MTEATHFGCGHAHTTPLIHRLGIRPVFAQVCSVEWDVDAANPMCRPSVSNNLPLQPRLLWLIDTFDRLNCSTNGKMSNQNMILAELGSQTSSYKDMILDRGNSTLSLDGRHRPSRRAKLQASENIGRVGSIVRPYLWQPSSSDSDSRDEDTWA